MASCTTCGNDLAEGAQFCTTCGTPAADTPVEAPPTESVPLTEPVPPTGPVPPSSWDPGTPAGAPTEAVPEAPLWNPAGAPEAAPGYAAGGQPPLWDPAGTGGSSSSGVPKVVLIGLGALVAFLLLGIGGVVFALTRGGDDGGEDASPSTTEEEQTTTTEDEPDDSTTTTEDEPATTSTTEDTGPGGLVPTVPVGTCVTNDLVAGGTLTSFDEVPCSELHRGEMFLKFDMPGGTFPGEEAINAAVVARCQGAEFTAYVGQAYATSSVYLSPVTPTEETWDEAADREVLCFLVEQDGSERTGSYEGTGL
jgi:hypothetical protein